MPGRVFCHGEDSIIGLFGSKNDQDQKAGIQRMRSSANAGLMWNRYLDLWGEGHLPELINGDSRRAVLDVFIRDFNARDKLRESAAVRLLRELHARQARVIDHPGIAGQAFEIALDARFATGLGSPHPTELGFTFERSSGIPYLPGSSVKGVARAAAQLLGETSIESLFGPERIDRGNRAAKGRLTFLDAYPTHWPLLELDVINCHHPNYYTHDEPPLESDDPVPVYFLTVAPKTSWTFRLTGASPRETARSVEILRYGLQELGAGAKTAVGYGVFIR